MIADSSSRKPVIITAWVFLLLASSIPMIFMREILHQTVDENLRSAMPAVVMLVGLALTFLWRAIRPLRPIFVLFLVLIGAQWVVYTKVDKISLYPTWINHPSFNVYMLAEQSLNLMVTLAVIAALFILQKRASAFFLAKGDTNAPAEPVNLLGIKEGDRWKKVGLTFAFFISLGTLAFLILAGKPPLDILVRVLPFIPAILLAATVNAFTEEVAYKASFLSVLENVVGKNHALWLMAAYFGIAHFYGIPYGIIGVILATFLGWFLGKSMLETRGLWWAWFIHFWQDVWIFLFLAIGSIIPGGG